MDIGGTAKAAKVASPESTVAIENSCAAPEISEKSAASGKNRSFPDSSVDSMEDSACAADSLGKRKDVSQESLSSSKKELNVVTEVAVDESNSIEALIRNPLKKSAVTTSTMSETSQAACVPTRDDTSCNDKLGMQEQTDEDDELLKRMEAIEKGEDLDDVPEDANHQNGMLQKMADKDGPGKATDECVNAGKAMTSSDASVSKCSEPDAASKSAEAVSPTFKRKHPFTVGEVEPQVKKVHIDDVTEGSELNATSLDLIHSTAKQLSESSVKSPGGFEPGLNQKEKEENPPSVENMEVDGSPEQEASSPKNVESLPDTEPNTKHDAMDEKSEEISSSVVEEPMRQTDNSVDNNKIENSNVSSSDDKREGMAGENTKPPDSEVSASVLPAPSVEEAMDVDDDENDMAESSTEPTASVAIPVLESPCIKKFAYQCGDEDAKQVDETVPVVSTEKSSATIATALALGGSAETSMITEQKGLGSASDTSSNSVAPTKPGDETEDMVDSSNIFSSVSKLVVESVEKHSESAKILPQKVVIEESIVESSQPSSSSDMKKQSLTGKRSNDQPLDRSVMLVKKTSTPNQNTVELTLSSPSVSSPKTLNTVTTSAVSSSNVYSSTPIHSNIGKISSGNLSKITNLPSSIETSRIEVDETTMTTTTITEKSEPLLKAETEEKNAVRTTSATKSLSSTTETASSPVLATMGTSDSSDKSTSPKKELRNEDSSSSKGSLKTSDDNSEVDSCTVASGMNTTEEINMYVSNTRKLNGISSTSEGSDMGTKDDMSKSLGSVKLEDDIKTNIDSIKLDLSRAISPTSSIEQQYEVSVWYEGKELQFMSVERIHGGTKLDPTATVDTVTHDASKTDSSSKQSSSATTNGSVSSIGPFTLTGSNTAHVGQSSDSSSSSVTVTGVKSTHSVTVPQMKQTVIGAKALCDLLIGEFQKLRRTFAPDDTNKDDTCTNLLKSPRTPYIGRGRKDSSKKSGSRSQKRSKAANSEDDDDNDNVGNDVCTPRSAGSAASKQPAKRTKFVLAASSNESLMASCSTTLKPKIVQEPKQFDICCLARWTDRKYYAGRVTNYREDNKYVVVFEDGCSKTLSRDIIVFGEDGVLPIQHHSIHVLTGGDTYEPAIVEEIKRNDANEVMYCVRTASIPLEVTATDIYLTDEQAKWIHNACKDKPDPIQKLLQSGSSVSSTGRGDAAGGNQGKASEGNSDLVASDLATDSGDKSFRSTRSKRGAGTNDKSLGSITPEAGYSGGVGKKGRRGRRLS